MKSMDKQRLVDPVAVAAQGVTEIGVITGGVSARLTWASAHSIRISDFPISTCSRAIPVWVDAEQYKVVGTCLAAARRRAKLTQQELAATLGKPQSFVSEYERGQRRVDVLELLTVAHALGADPIKLFRQIVAAIRSDAG